MSSISADILSLQAIWWSNELLLEKTYPSLDTTLLQEKRRVEGLFEKTPFQKLPVVEEDYTFLGCHRDLNLVFGSQGSQQLHSNLPPLSQSPSYTFPLSAVRREPQSKGSNPVLIVSPLQWGCWGPLHRVQTSRTPSMPHWTFLAHPVSIQ